MKVRDVIWAAGIIVFPIALFSGNFLLAIFAAAVGVLGCLK